MDILSEEKKDIQRSSQSFFSGTVLSRVLGLVRDIVMAYFFGASTSIAALMVAFRFSSLLRRIFGEGALHAAFVPAYEKLRKDSESEGAHFFADLSLLMSGCLFLIVLLVEFALFVSIKGGYLGAHNQEIALLMMILFPSLLFICHAAFCGSFLQCQGVYFLPAISPVFFNLFWISGALACGLFFQQKFIYLLAFFIGWGLFMQWLILFPKTLLYLKKYLQGSYSMHFKQMLNRSKALGKPLFLGLIGVSTTQLNNALDTIFARFIDLKGPAYLWYALRVQQVPIAIFGIALVGALLPMLTRAALRSHDDFVELLDYSVQRSLSLLLPCSFALLAMGPSTVNLLYGRGQFSALVAQETTYCLWGYALGLTAHGLALILASAYYAKNEYKIPTLITAQSLVVNIVLNLLFACVFKWGSFGVAFATSFASVFQLVSLLARLGQQFEGFRLPQSAKTCIKVFCVCTLSGSIVLISNARFGSYMNFSEHFLIQFNRFSIELALFVGSLFGIAWLFRVKEIFSLLEFIPKIRRN